MSAIADLPLTQNDRLAIEAAVQLLYQNFPVQQVILYGSKVTGKATQESDIDLLVLTQRSLTWQERDAITDALFDLELAYDVVLSTLIVSYAEWMSGNYTLLPIHQEIEREGVAA
ncbi:MAG: nucleotidyltransferase domain-containing protein [Thainema sp.]